MSVSNTDDLTAGSISTDFTWRYFYNAVVQRTIYYLRTLWTKNIWPIFSWVFTLVRFLYDFIRVHFRFYVKVLIFNILNYFKFEPYKWRVLPVMKKSKSEEERTVHVNGVNIVIKIIYGLNLPERNDGNVAAFVECSLNNFTVESGKSVGANPIWNEEFVVPLE